MPVYVSDLFTATAAPVNATPTSTRTWQWLRGSSAISGATSATYTAVTADIGSTLSATQLETNFLATTTATSAATEVVQAFDPIRLFSASEPGVWYDPSDMSTLYQNATGTIPVTSFGQPVGLMLDKSRGLVLGPELVVNGGFATAGDWGPNLTGASISGGKINFSSAPDNAGMFQTKSGYLGSAYSITVVIDSISSGAITVTVGVPSPSASNAVVLSTAGTHTFRFGNFSGDTYIRVYAEGASTTAVVDSVSVKAIQGLHATQSTDASRPLYGIVPVSGRRNLLTQTEAFNEAVWAVSRATKGAAQLDPNGGMTAIRITATSANGDLAQSTSAANVNHANSVWVRRVSGTGDVQLGNPANTLTTLALTSSWQRFSTSGLPASGTTAYLLIRILTSGDVIDVAFAQQELGSTPTAYQRVSTDLDVTEAGVASVGYLRFDGSTSWMVTPTITPGTDKVQVFAGVRKLSDAALGIVAEYSASLGAGNPGSFFLTAPRTAATGDFAFNGGGTAFGSGAVSSNSFPAPTTRVLAGLGDIAGDLATLRIDGVQAATSATDQGTGDFLAYQMYLGRRGGTSLPFNGHLFPLIVRFGPNLTAARISATEAWVATKTAGVVLP